MQELRTQAQEREELLVGILACEIINWSSGAPKKPFRPSDLGLGPKLKQKVFTPVEATPESIHEQHIAWRRDLHSDLMIEKPEPPDVVG